MQKVKLGSICKLRQGFQVPLPEQEVENKPGYVRFIRIVDYTQQTSDIRYVEDNEKYYYVEPDDVVMIRYGAAGEVGHGIRGVIANNMFLIEPQIDINKDYLFYYLAQKKIRERLLATSTSTTMPALNFKIVNELEIPLYDKDKQDYLVMIFELLSGIIKKRKDELQTLDELIKARFVELFGDGRDGKTPVKMLGNICKFQQGTQIPVEEQFEEQKDGYKRFLRIIDYTQAPQPPRYVNVNGKEVDEKSVVVVRYGATAGFVGRGYQGILANNLFEIIPDETILSKDFLFLALKYGTFEKEVHDKAFGAAMPALSFSMMNDIPVVVPMADEQKQFVSFVEQTDKSKVVVQKALDEAQLLFDSLMQKYFG